MNIKLTEMAIGQQASFKKIGFLTRSGETEITLAGIWPEELLKTWTAEAKRLSWTIVRAADLKRL